MTWIKIQHRKVPTIGCLETGQELSLISCRKGFQLHLTNLGVIASYEKEEDGLNAFILISDKVNALTLQK